MTQEHFEYFRSLPPGYRFAPKDEELIHHYLSKKVKNLELPPNNIVDQNIYDHNPAYLAERYREYGEKEWYFFTPRERKYLNGERPNRSAGDGYWKATGADKPITREGMCIGSKKALVFYKGQAPKGDKTNWIMHEYRIPKPPTKNEKRKNNDMRLDDWVLCRIYEKNERSSPKGRSNQDGDQLNDIDNTIIPAIDDQPDPSILMMHDQDHQHFVGESILQDMPPLENIEDESLTNALNSFAFTDSQVPFLYSLQQQHQQQQQQMPYNYMDNIKLEEQQQQLPYNYIDNYIEDQHHQQFLYDDYVDQNNFLPLSYSTVPVPPDPLDVLPPPDHLLPLKKINYQYCLDGNVYGNVKLEEDKTFPPQS